MTFVKRRIKNLKEVKSARSGGGGDSSSLRKYSEKIDKVSGKRRRRRKSTVKSRSAIKRVKFERLR